MKGSVIFARSILDLSEKPPSDFGRSSLLANSFESRWTNQPVPETNVFAASGIRHS
jgi:hypothetical protein